MSNAHIAILGIVGALIPEVLRAIASLRNNKKPTALELLASLLTALLGLGVLLFDNDKSSNLQVAVQGAAFPSLFSGLVAAAVKQGEDTERATADNGRSIWDYLAWRL